MANGKQSKSTLGPSFANEDHGDGNDHGSASSSRTIAMPRINIFRLTLQHDVPPSSPRLMMEQCNSDSASDLFNGTHVIPSSRHANVNQIECIILPWPSSRIRMRRNTSSVILTPSSNIAMLSKCRYTNNKRYFSFPRQSPRQSSRQSPRQSPRQHILRLSVTLCLLLVSCVSHVACSTTMQQQHHHHQQQQQHQRRRIRRRNNTGFYYGIRDDDMLRQQQQRSSPFTPSTSSLPLRLPLSKVPIVSGLNSLSARLRHSSPGLSSTKRELEREEITKEGQGRSMPSQTIIWSGAANTAEGGTDDNGAYYDSGASILLNQQQQQQQHGDDEHSQLHSMHQRRRASLASAVREGLTRSFDGLHSLNHSLNSSLNNYGVPLYSLSNLREKLTRASQSLLQHPSLSSMVSYDWKQHQHQLQQQQQYNDVNVEESAMSLLGTHDDDAGGNCMVSQQQSIDPQYYSGEDDTTVVSASTTTKQLPSKNLRGQKGGRKRRKNNTGFYYGIREDVLEKNDHRANNGGHKSRQQLLPPPLVHPEHSREESTDKGDKRQRQQQQRPSILPQRPFSKPSHQKDDDEATNKKRNRKKKSSPLPKLSPRKKMATSSSSSNNDNNMSNILLDETMLELRGMREEIIALREELRAVQDKFREQQGGGMEGGDRETAPSPKHKRGRISKEEQKGPPELELESPKPSLDDESREEEKSSSSKHLSTRQKRQKRREFERIAKDVEKWASQVLDEELDRTADGWKPVVCNKFVKKKFNKDGRTEVYVKWMPDSRDEKDIDSISAAAKKDTPYPCLKIYTTIDAPLDRVCSFLSRKETIPLYNELVVEHDDVEEISPNSKITWTQCPKILIVKPRDFVTYCSHRWLGDGTQVLVNQACEHEDRPGVMLEGEGKVCRAFALRGANFISKDPDDPNKTRITMLSHANPGGGLPQWALTTAVNAVVAVEPFKFLHRINEGVCNHYEEDEESTTTMDVVNKDDLTGRSNKPAGIAHLGFTCLWPNGGGVKVGEERSNTNPSFATNPPLSSSPALPQDEDDDVMWRNDMNDGEEDGANDMEEFDD